MPAVNQTKQSAGLTTRGAAAVRDRPFADYAVIGDMRGAALVAPDAAIEWLCLSRFDADPFFLKLLDMERGGACTVSLRGGAKATRRRYQDGTNILDTVLEGMDGTLVVTDFMPVQGMLASKFWGPINLRRAADKQLTPQGSLLFFSGLAAYRQGPGSSIVGAVNMALESLAAALAIELKPKRVNVISPGVVNSATWSGMGEDERTAFFADTAGGLPVGRVGEVEDEAHAALAVLENGFINGTVVNVDGGGRVA